MALAHWPACVADVVELHRETAASKCSNLNCQIVMHASRIPTGPAPRDAAIEGFTLKNKCKVRVRLDAGMKAH
jgi:hypothetical protein